VVTVAVAVEVEPESVEEAVVVAVELFTVNGKNNPVPRVGLIEVASISRKSPDVPIFPAPVTVNATVVAVMFVESLTCPQCLYHFLS
jgi:hypothetical protein